MVRSIQMAPVWLLFSLLKSLVKSNHYKMHWITAGHSEHQIFKLEL